MSSCVFAYDEMLDLEFKNKKISLDACFILAYLDSYDTRGDKISKLLDLWNESGISQIGYSAYVAAEVVHNIFKKNIKDVLQLAYRNYLSSSKGKAYHYSPNELGIIADVQNAERLRKIVPQRIMEKLNRDGELNYSIETIIKDFKKQFPQNRDYLSIFYQRSVQTFSEFISSFEDMFEMKFEVLHTTNDSFNSSLDNSSYFQFSMYDSIHLSVSSANGYDYFATLDGDFLTDYYFEAKNILSKILKVA